MHSSSPHSFQDPQAEAAKWYARRRSGDCSSDEQKSFLRWLNVDEANRKAYDEVESLWQQLGGLETGRHIEEARAHLAAARRRPARRRMLGFALAASLIAALSWSWLDFSDEQIYRTAVGGRQDIALADGSRLELDTDSEIVVRYSRHHRELELVRGQAAFTVVHDGARPFVVRAGKRLIRDIGTQFNVRKDADRLSVAVMAGEIEVSGSDGTQSLHQGQKLSYSSQGRLSSVESVDVAATTAWRSGQLVFRAQPLGEVLAELERYHAVKLVVTSSRIMTTKVSGTFPTDDLALALKTMAAAIPIKVTRTGPASWRIDG